MAALTHDSSWPVAAGGRVPEELHQNGLSRDGTTDYLDALAAKYPDNVRLYRNAGGRFWDGKREMVNAPLAAIDEECLLFQIDADELWTVEQLESVRQMFLADPTRTAAWYWCWFFVGEELVVSSRRGWSANPRGEWVRTWRYRPGMRWAAHSPPVLIEQTPSGRTVNVGLANPFFHDETEARGLRFQHFAYVTPESLRWKETYYGYAGALAGWQALQAETRFPRRLRDFFGWVKDDTEVDTAQALGVTPLARQADGHWRFAASAPLVERTVRTRARAPVVAVDGVFYQALTGGIGRVWRMLLDEWAKDGFGEQIVILDRAYSTPRVPGIRSRAIAPLDYADLEGDRARLQRACDDEGAAVFISTYHTTPLTTPSVILVHDMIPEVYKWDLSHPMWRDKHHGIRHARAFIAVSQRTAFDLARLFPDVVRLSDIVVAHHGVAPYFAPAPEEAIARFRAAHGIDRPYFLVIGHRGGTYKNTGLFFRSLAKLPDRERYAVVCAGVRELDEEQRRACAGMGLYVAQLPENELIAAYSGALALVYPSAYEGFGLPLLEAMACGCPVIACPVASIPEVLGDAGLYVSPADVDGLTALLDEVQRPAVRARCRERGLARAHQFSWARAAATIRDVLLRVADPSPARRA